MHSWKVGLDRAGLKVPHAAARKDPPGRTGRVPQAAARKGPPGHPEGSLIRPGRVSQGTPAGLAAGAGQRGAVLGNIGDKRAP